MRSLTPNRLMNEHRFSTLRHVYADGVLFPLESSPPFKVRNGLIFVGNLNNPTNLHGLRWFMTQVWPLLRRRDPQMILRVVGSLDGDGTAKSDLPALMESASGVDVSGYVGDDELGRMLQQSRVFIAPIRWATGIVTKQTLAHVHGLPTVVTSVAARRLAPAPLDALGLGEAWSHRLGRYEPVRVAAVADTAADYAEAILHLHSNESSWKEMSLNAARYARSGGHGGKGVCPVALADDWLAFWAKLQASVCG